MFTVIHYFIYSCKVELDEIRQEILSLEFRCQHPSLRLLYEFQSMVLTVDHLQDILVSIFGPVGSNSTMTEEASMMIVIGLLDETE